MGLTADPSGSLRPTGPSGNQRLLFTHPREGESDRDCQEVPSGVEGRGRRRDIKGIGFID